MDAGSNSVMLDSRAGSSARATIRLRWLLVFMLTLAFIAIGGPLRVLSGVAYALERGRIQASSEGLAELDAVSNAFRLVANVARPGVVQIVASSRREGGFAQLRERRDELQREIGEIESRLDDGEMSETESMELFRRERALRFERAQIDAFLERRREGTGSGVVLDEQGHILTNNHVASAGDELTVRLSDGRTVDGRVVGADSLSDLAVIRVNATNLHPLKFGDSDAMDVGDWVLAVGAPFGLDQTVTHGIISAKGRTDIAIGHGIVYQDFLQTDASINPGNSGGPLLNLRGEVIGINTAIATSTEGYNAGVAFTIPSNMARRIADQLRRDGEVARGWLGITMDELTADDRELFGVAPGTGVLVDQIIPDDPAEQGGVQIEDVIIAVNNRPVANLGQLRGLIADVFPGESATLRVVRGRQPLDLQITFGRRPAALTNRLPRLTEQSDQIAPIPAGLRTLRPSRARLFDRKEGDRGVRVVEVNESAGSKLRPDDLILSVNGERVETLDVLRRRISAIGSAALQLQVADSRGATRTVVIERGE